MFHRQQKFYTPEEYLTLEETADYRSEYYRGEIFAMSGGSINHNRIAGNFYSALNFAFENGPCEAFMSDVRLLVKQNGLYTYPDVMVVCAQLQFVANRTDTITNPILIVEVLSESTEGYDRGKKFEFYRMIPTLQHYLLVAQDRVHLEYFHKRADSLWVLQEFNDINSVLKIDALALELPLSRIYSRVEFEIADENST
jgi:Uma2 family endonuclease